MWNIPPQIVSILKRYTGEEKTTIKKPKDKRRMFANEFSEVEQKAILKWLKENYKKLSDNWIQHLQSFGN